MLLLPLTLTLLSLTTLAFALPPPNTPSAPQENNTTTPLTTSNPLKSPRLNCSGSLYCSLYAGNFIFRAYKIATLGHPKHDETLDPTIWNLGPMNDTAFYATGHHALCLPINMTLKGGFCVFAQGVGGEEGGVSGKVVKGVLRGLIERGCRMCGSVGLEEGGGWITANYVNGDVCGGVCPDARYR
ncbi:MAG: hypothetical protein Q9166_002397 [cf. Caloplaca sp. 2 TL-2023]